MRRRFGFAVWRCWELRDNVKHLNYIRMKRILISIMALVALCFTATAQQKGEQSLGMYLGYDTGVKGYNIYLGSVGIIPS